MRRASSEDKALRVAVRPEPTRKEPVTRYVNRKVRRIKAAKREFRPGMPCHWCSRPMKRPGDASGMAATRDHVHPKSLGGRYQVWACRACNNIKGSMTERQWRTYMDANPNWWHEFAASREFSAAILRNGVGRAPRRSASAN